MQFVRWVDVAQKDNDSLLPEWPQQVVPIHQQQQQQQRDQRDERVQSHNQSKRRKIHEFKYHTIHNDWFDIPDMDDVVGVADASAGDDGGNANINIIGKQTTVARNRQGNFRGLAPIVSSVPRTPIWFQNLPKFRLPVECKVRGSQALRVYLLDMDDVGGNRFWKLPDGSQVKSWIYCVRSDDSCPENPTVFPSVGAIVRQIHSELGKMHQVDAWRELLVTVQHHGNEYTFPLDYFRLCRNGPGFCRHPDWTPEWHNDLVRKSLLCSSRQNARHIHLLRSSIPNVK